MCLGYAELFAALLLGVVVGIVDGARCLKPWQVVGRPVVVPERAVAVVQQHGGLGTREAGVRPVRRLGVMARAPSALQ